jgi:DeoD family purine-nucleoside phosphorylase
MLTRGVPHHLTTPPSRQSPLALCPGDPDRARLVARELLEGAELVTEARGLLGYTGRYRGVPVTVQTTGMGGGSTAIVVHELIELGARCLVRAGSAGGLDPEVPLGALLVADRAVAEDGAALALCGAPDAVPPPDAALTGALAAAAAAGTRPAARGPVVSTDVFYDADPDRGRRWRDAGLMAVEMEAATLFTVAARHGARAGCVLGVGNRVGDEHWPDRAAFAELGLAVAEAGLAGLVEAG